MNLKWILFYAATAFMFLSCSKNNSGGSTPPSSVDTLYNWVKGPPAGAELDDIWFFDEKNGLVVTTNSLFSSADSGNTFTAVSNTTNLKAFSIYFLNNQYGFVQGSTQLGITQDGGKTWTTKGLASNYGFTSKFLFPSTGYYSDYNKGLYKTTDSGSSWKLILDSVGRGPNFLFDFVDTLHGFVMVNGNFSKTTDGGASWQSVASSVMLPDFSGYYKMQFLDTLNGYCASPQGIYKTTNGGKNWTNKFVRATTYMVPYFFDVNNGYLLAANNIYKTTDGGDNWTVSCKLGQDDFSALYFLDMNTGWATTFAGYVLRLKS